MTEYTPRSTTFIELGYNRFLELEESFFPNNEGDYACSFMNPHTPASEPSIQPNSHICADLYEGWRYVGRRVWTGEALQYAPCPQPDNAAYAFSRQTNAIKMTRSPKYLKKSRKSGILPPSGGSQSYGTLSGSHKSSNAPQRPMGESLFQEKRRFQFIGWNDEAKQMLYRWKRIQKKGYSVFMRHFPGETEESLRAAWEKFRDEGKRIYDAWAADISGE